MCLTCCAACALHALLYGIVCINMNYKSCSFCARPCFYIILALGHLVFPPCRTLEPSACARPSERIGAARAPTRPWQQAVCFLDPTHCRTYIVKETASDQSADFKVRVGLPLQSVQHVLLCEQGEECGRSAALVYNFARVEIHDYELVRVCSPLFVLILLRLHVYL